MLDLVAAVIEVIFAGGVITGLLIETADVIADDRATGMS